MLTIDQAFELVSAHAPPPDAATAGPVALVDAVGRVLAEDVRADLDLPPFARSTMDGFAMRAADAAGPGARLEVVGESAAGRPFEGRLGRGQATRIYTGAALPAGADAVVMVERTRMDGGDVVLEIGAVAGRNVSLQGEDARAGDVVARAGERITPGHVGVLASCGAVAPRVFARPRVAILATGTELVAPDQRPGAGQIRESNGAVLSALCAAAGAEVHRNERVPDERERILAAARAAATCDVLLVSGGSSVGDYDFTPEVLKELGATVHFDRVALKPGKPTLFATLPGAHPPRAAFGIPGNPVSAFVVFHLFVAPTLARRGGAAHAAPELVHARLDGALKRVAAREQVLPARLRADAGTLRVAFSGWHGSGDVGCTRHANALLFVPAGAGEEPKGALVRVLPLPGSGCGATAVPGP